MERILICPGERRPVAFLAQAVPLVALPILGENLLAYWLEVLATAGVKDVRILATDRPEMIRALVGDGSRWGVRVQVQAELREGTPEEAAALFPGETDSAGSLNDPIIMLDHFPGLESAPLFRSYRDWFTAVLAWMPQAAAKASRIGLREIQPQVWCGRRTQVAPSATLHPPCWLGDQAVIGPEAIIGPETVLENRVVVDVGSEIRASVVGPDTFVGALTKVDHSIAWGNNLIDWRSGSCTQVPDPFLLCALGQRYLPERALPRGLPWKELLGSFLARPGAFVADVQARWRRP